MSKVALFFDDLKHLFRSIPSLVVALFFLSVVLMNLFANKTIVNLPYLALDGGFLLSWIAFLTMDVLTKHYGAKAADKVNVVALLISLFLSFMCWILSIIPTPEQDYSAFNSIFGGTWFILLSSGIAFLLSGFVNNALNALIHRLFKNRDGGPAFFLSSYVSTLVGQIVDNFTFSALTFMVFAPIFWGPDSAWTFVQCLTGALTGALAELLMEVVFSPIGFYITKDWKKNGVGEDYFAYRREIEAKKQQKQA